MRKILFAALLICVPAMAQTNNEQYNQATRDYWKCEDAQLHGDKSCDLSQLSKKLASLDLKVFTGNTDKLHNPFVGAIKADSCFDGAHSIPCSPSIDDLQIEIVNLKAQTEALQETIRFLLERDEKIQNGAKR